MGLSYPLLTRVENARRYLYLLELVKVARGESVRADLLKARVDNMKKGPVGP